MASTTVSLILESKASGNGIKQTVSDLKAAQNQVRQLATAEKARAAASKASLAQQRASIVQQQQAANQSAASQLKVAAAIEKAKAANAAAEIAAKRHALSLTQVADKADEVGGRFSKFGALASAGAAVANAAFAGLLATITAVGAGVGALGVGLKNASDLEVQNVLQAGNISRVTGIDNAASTQLLQQLSSAIKSGSGGGVIDTGVSKQFANTFFDDVLQNFGNNASSIDLTANLANKLSGLTTLGGNDKGQVLNAVTDLISGSLTSASIDTRDVFNSSGLTKIITQELNAAGKKLEDLNAGERIQLLNTALNKALSSDTVQQLQGTVQGQLSTLKNRLIGEDGIFSVTRDLLPDVAGQQDVFEQFKKSIGLLFNSDGLFAQLSRILSDNGINLDIMAGIRSGWLRFNQFLVGLNQFLTTTSDLNAIVNGAGIGQAIGNLVNKAIDSINFGAVGVNTAIIVNKITNLITNTLTTVDWGQLGIGIATAIGSFVQNLSVGSWIAIAVALATPILANAALGIVTSLGGVLLSAAGTALAGIAATFAAALAGVPILVVAAVAGIVVAVIGLVAVIASNWQQIQAAVSNAWAQIVSFTVSAASSISSAVSQGWNSALASVQSAWNAIVSSVQSAWQSLISTIQGLWASLVATVQGAWSGLISGVQSALQSLANAIIQPIQSAASSASSFFGGITDAISGLAGAISGAVSSARSAVSTISTGNQTTASAQGSLYIASSSASVGGGGGVGIINLTINQQPGQNAKELAQYVISEIEMMVRREAAAY